MATFYFIWIIRIRLKGKRYPNQSKKIQISGRIGLQIGSCTPLEGICHPPQIGSCVFKQIGPSVFIPEIGGGHGTGIDSEKIVFFFRTQSQKFFKYRTRRHFSLSLVAGVCVVLFK